MCGIYGFVNTDGMKVSIDSDEYSDFFSCRLRHRGPDGSGRVSDEKNYLFGHRRLSIIDLSGNAQQPIKSDESSMTFNGEIYNFKDLRAQYDLVGSEFSSDTRVLFELLNKNGAKCLNELNGMFAFAYRNKKGETLLVRDRYGVKPLYYTKINGVLYFSSEIKPLQDYFGLKKFNEPVYQDLLDHCKSDFSKETIFEGIFQVPSGCYLKISQHNMSVVRWYQIKKKRTASSIEKYEDLLTSAIERRLISDAPVCISLSGGLDSTSIYTLINERLDTKIHAFTCTHETTETNEEPRVQKLVDYYGSNLTKVESKFPAAESLASIERSVLATEYPIWSISALDYDALYKSMSAKGFKVALEGHGADEFLSGYGYMMRQMIVDQFRAFKFKDAVTLQRYLMQVEPNMLQNGALLFLKFSIGNILSSMGIKGDIRSSFNTRLDACNKDILPMVLRCFDRLSMKNSIESRAPFMDVNLVEASLGLDAKYMLSEQGGKTVLREILKKYGHSEIASYKKKLGFASDLNSINYRRGFWESVQGDTYFSANRSRYPIILSHLRQLSNPSNKNFGEKFFYSLYRELGILIFERNISNVY
jgi:asparagine synthase (glutamine-hydrolysing)